MKLGTGLLLTTGIIGAGVGLYMYANSSRSNSRALNKKVSNMKNAVSKTTKKAVNSLGGPVKSLGQNMQNL